MGIEYKYAMFGNDGGWTIIRSLDGIEWYYYDSVGMKDTAKMLLKSLNGV